MDNRLNDNARPQLGGGRTGITEQGDNQRRAAAAVMQQDSTGAAGRQDLRAASGRVVATVDGDCLKKQLDGSKHLLRKPPGIAFDADILEAAERAGAVRVEVRDRETGITYRSTLADFWTHGVKLDRGFGLQVCLPFGFWLARRPGAPVQLGLF
jgi:hypothetical protein